MSFATVLKQECPHVVAAIPAMTALLTTLQKPCGAHEATLLPAASGPAAAVKRTACGGSGAPAGSGCGAGGTGSTYSQQYVGIEAQLGRCHDAAAFAPGVDQAFVARLLCQLEACEYWAETTPWAEVVERYYMLPSGVMARTVNEVSRDGDYITAHLRRSELGHVDLHWAHAPADVLMKAADGSVYDVRVWTKREDPVLEDELPVRVDDTALVRMRMRRCFRYTPSGTDRVRWSIEVSMVWERPGYWEAMEAWRDNLPALYEVTLECRHPIEYLRRLHGNVDYLATSMLLKIADLFETGTGAGLAASPARLVARLGAATLTGGANPRGTA